MIKVGIIGGSGYTGGELIRILLHHTKAEIDFVFSTTRAGKKITTAHADLLGVTDLAFTGKVNANVDLVFLCLGHGNSTTFLEENPFSKNTKIIDLSNDFRLNKDAVFQGKKFIYGLPELLKADIKSANYIANPGCFATAIQLALLPLAKANKLNDEVHINAVTGSTGAGVSPSATSHFSWRNNNASWYKPFTHQHLGEIGESLAGLQENVGSLFFLPNRGNFTRGIFASIYTKTDLSENALLEIFQNYYKDAPFTHITNKTIHLKQVVNTNNCLIQIQKIDGKVLITSVIDNLIKGAAGQAIQNMNLMFGIEETTGLKYKATFF